MAFFDRNRKNTGCSLPVPSCCGTTDISQKVPIAVEAGAGGVTGGPPRRPTQEPVDAQTAEWFSAGTTALLSQQLCSLFADALKTNAAQLCVALQSRWQAAALEAGWL